MGSCCGNDRVVEDESLVSNIDHETWYTQQVYFDSTSFRSAIKKADYQRIQRKLKILWKDLRPKENGDTSFQKGVRWSEIERMRPTVWRGVPFASIKQLIVFLFGLDEKAAERQYAEARSRASEQTGLRNSTSPSKISAFLTATGVMVVKDLRHILLFECKEVEATNMLPRVTQLLLWYLNENLAYSLLHTLLTEQKITYFPSAIGDYEELYMKVLRVVIHVSSPTARQYFSEEQFLVLIKDMMDNLLVGYVRAEYFGCVLMVFLATGVLGIAQIVTMLIMSTSSATLAKIDWTVEENLKAEFQTSCMFGVDFLKVLEGAKSVDLSEPVSSESEPSHTPFLPFSVILPSAESQSRVLTYLPDSTRSLHRVFQASTHTLGDLYTTWKACKEPQLLLVRVASNNIFGLYLDRAFASFEEAAVAESESMLIQVEPVLEGKRHIKPFRVRLSTLHDLEFVEGKGDAFLVLSQELKFGNRRPSAAFNTTVKDDFVITEVELFTLRRALSIIV